ncbi:hypothetical protein B0H16DRAFT_1478212 [Mycena metata]|uniref:Uncharacterized protein n=1 Tax=Mycena metata TaxID=1033252 RepID=A0AAD7MF09_9AGAR|nr:hypothetical protein B0H16DRAFT_1478212 [Mycena metata]
MLGSSTAFTLLLLSGAASTAFGPTFQRCPADFQLVRRGQSISAAESQYIKDRREKVLPDALKAYSQNVKRTGIELPKYVEEILESTQFPTVGISTSGGGDRGKRRF